MSEPYSGSQLFGALLALAGGKLAVWWALHKKPPPTAVYVGTVSAIHLHPVKSCRGIKVDQAVSTYAGWKHPQYDLMDRYM